MTQISICSPVNSCKIFSIWYPMNIKKFKFVFLWQNGNIISVTEQIIVASKIVSLNIPVVGSCSPFYRTKASTLLEMSFFTGVL